MRVMGHGSNGKVRNGGTVGNGGTADTAASRAWAEVAGSLEALARGLKLHQEPSADPIRSLAAKITGAMAAAGDTVHAPAVEQALRETAEAIPAGGRHAARRPAKALEPAWYVDDVLQAADSGDGDRRVLFTGPQSRLVVTTLQPGTGGCPETHPGDRVVLLLKGTGERTIDGRVQACTGGDAWCVPAGTSHDVRNTGTEPLRIATVYAPARHPSGAVRRDKAAARAA